MTLSSGTMTEKRRKITTEDNDETDFGRIAGSLWLFVKKNYQQQLQSCQGSNNTSGVFVPLSKKGMARDRYNHGEYSIKIGK